MRESSRKDTQKFIIRRKAGKKKEGMDEKEGHERKRRKVFGGKVLESPRAHLHLNGHRSQKKHCFTDHYRQELPAFSLPLSLCSNVEIKCFARSVWLPEARHHHMHLLWHVMIVTSLHDGEESGQG